MVLDVLSASLLLFDAVLGLVFLISPFATVFFDLVALDLMSDKL